MKQKSITTEQILQEEKVNSLYVNYQDFAKVVKDLILKRQLKENKDNSFYNHESAQAEFDGWGGNIYQYWLKKSVTPQQAFNVFFK